MSLSFPVSIEKNASLLRRMAELGITENHFEETFIRSGGNGGQNVNKVATAVLLVHTPSGLSIKCSIYRTQGLNRYKARALLCDKIAEWKNGVSGSKSSMAREKIQKRKKDKARKAKKKYESGDGTMD